MENIRRRCNPIVDLLKFTYNKKLLNETTTNFITKLYHKNK